MKIQEPPSRTSPREGFELSRDGIRITGQRRISDVLLVLTAGTVHLFSRVIDNVAPSIRAQITIALGFVFLIGLLVGGLVGLWR